MRRWLPDNAHKTNVKWDYYTEYVRSAWNFTNAWNFKTFSPDPGNWRIYLNTILFSQRRRFWWSRFLFYCYSTDTTNLLYQPNTSDDITSFWSHKTSAVIREWRAYLRILRPQFWKFQQEANPTPDQPRNAPLNFNGSLRWDRQRDTSRPRQWHSSRTYLPVFIDTLVLISSADDRRRRGR